jgi:nitroreductase
MACSSGNTQPWEFLVVTDAEIKKRIKDEMVIGFSTIDAERSQTPDQLVDGVGRPITGHAAVENIDKVPAIVVVCWNPERGIRMKGEYAENPDGTLRATREIPGGRGVSLFQACQNMMLAARALGVDSLFATFFFLRNDQIKKILGIPPHIFMESCVFLGYADEKLGRPRRKPLSEVAHLNQWGNRYQISSPR